MKKKEILQNHPWISIWTEPKSTIVSIISTNSRQSIWLLAWIYGFLSLLNCSQSFSIGYSLSFLPVLLLTVVLAPIWGMILFGVWGWLLLWTGKPLKGRGDFQSIRAAYAWSCVPLVVNILLWFILISVFGQSLFQRFPESRSLSYGLIALFYVILSVKVISAIWSLVLSIHTLAAVQRFSIARSILNMVFAWILLGVILGLFWWSMSSLQFAESIPARGYFFIVKE